MDPHLLVAPKLVGAGDDDNQPPSTDIGKNVGLEFLENVGQAAAGFLAFPGVSGEEKPLGYCLSTK